MLGILSFNAQAQDTKAQKTPFECNLDYHKCEMKIMKAIPYEKGVTGAKVDLD